MTREDLKPGATVVARCGLAYNTRASTPIKYVTKGTRGRVLRLQEEQGWTSVEVLFDGHDAIYHCDIPAAVFALSVAEV